MNKLDIEFRPKTGLGARRIKHTRHRSNMQPHSTAPLNGGSASAAAAPTHARLYQNCHRFYHCSASSSSLHFGHILYNFEINFGHQRANNWIRSSKSTRRVPWKPDNEYEYRRRIGVRYFNYVLKFAKRSY